jgi:hypothetical protein
MLPELNNGTLSSPVNKPQFSFWSQINRLLREWVG